jgi:hypothetical protein
MDISCHWVAFPRLGLTGYFAVLKLIVLANSLTSSTIYEEAINNYL